MAQRSRKAVSRTSTVSVKASPLNSKSRSLSKAALLTFNSRLCMSGEKRALSRVSWKRLRKRYRWLRQLRRHQKRGVEAILSTNGFAALFAQRTGKTWVTGAVLTVARKKSRDVLLVGPLTNLESTWGSFLRERLPWYSVHRDLESYDKHRKEHPDDYRILLLNPEQVTPIRDKLKRRKWDWFIWDEAQRLKNRSSQSSRDAYHICRSAKRRLALTGTPMDRDPKDLWAIMRFVNPDVLGTKWSDFEDEYLKKPNIDLSKKMGVLQRQRMLLAYQIAKRKAPMKKSKLKKYARLLSPHVMRISKEDAGITPANIHEVLFDLDPQEERRYRKLEKSMVVKVKGQVIKTPLKITKIGKLQQLTGGHIKDEEGNTHEVGTSKRRMLRKVIEQNIDGFAQCFEPFVVFCKYTWEVHMIHRLLTRMDMGQGAKLWGKVKDMKRDKRRTNMLLAFQRGEYPWIVCQQRTGGVGVDLYRARKAFVYSMGHSFIDFDQMLSRLDFLDQKAPADFFLLMVRKSIDTDIGVSVKGKKSVTNAFYDRLR